MVKGVIKKRFLGGVLLGIFVYGIFIFVFAADTLYLLQSVAEGAAVSQCVFVTGQSAVLCLG